MTALIERARAVRRATEFVRRHRWPVLNLAIAWDGVLTEAAEGWGAGDGSPHWHLPESLVADGKWLADNAWVTVPASPRVTVRLVHAVVVLLQPEYPVLARQVVAREGLPEDGWLGDVVELLRSFAVDDTVSPAVRWEEGKSIFGRIARHAGSGWEARATDQLAVVTASMLCDAEEANRSTTGSRWLQGELESVDDHRVTVAITSLHARISTRSHRSRTTGDHPRGT